VTSRGELKEIESFNVAEVDSRNISESLNHGCLVVENNQRSKSSSPSAISGLSLTSSDGSVVVDLQTIIVCIDFLQESNGILGLSNVINSRVVDDKGDLRNSLDSMSSGHDQSGNSRSSQS